MAKTLLQEHSLHTLKSAKRKATDGIEDHRSVLIHTWMAMDISLGKRQVLGLGHRAFKHTTHDTILA